MSQENIISSLDVVISGHIVPALRAGLWTASLWFMLHHPDKEQMIVGGKHLKWVFTGTAFCCILQPTGSAFPVLFQHFNLCAFVVACDLSPPASCPVWITHPSPRNRTSHYEAYIRYVGRWEWSVSKVNEEALCGQTQHCGVIVFQWNTQKWNQQKRKKWGHVII